MKERVYAEIITEKSGYAENGVHKGMQGQIERRGNASGYWIVVFSVYGREIRAAIFEEDMQIISGEADPSVNERIGRSFGEEPQGEKKLMEMDTVEIIVENKRYTAYGVHRGMQGWICGRFTNGCWLVNFPQYGGEENIATIDVREADLRPISNMDAQVNERISKAFRERI